MEKPGSKTLVINADTIATSQLRGKNLWGKADEEPQMIFPAPEQLVSKEFGTLIKDDGMHMLRTCILVVHLLNTWGMAFQKAYQQIGWVCARLHNPVLLALSATMINPVCFSCGAITGSHVETTRRQNWTKIEMELEYKVHLTVRKYYGQDTEFEGSMILETSSYTPLEVGELAFIRKPYGLQDDKQKT